MYSQNNNTMTSIKKVIILYKFKKLRERLSLVEDINHGGCAIAAYIMYMWLKERGIKSEMVYMYRHSFDGYTQNNSYLNNERSLAFSCSHAGIILNGEVIDCNETLLLDMFRYNHKVSPELVLNSLTNTSVWNDSFDREVSIPIIEKFSGIKINLACV